jgi:hypothetical protein
MIMSTKHMKSALVAAVTLAVAAGAASSAAEAGGKKHHGKFGWYPYVDCDWYYFKFKKTGKKKWLFKYEWCIDRYGHH